MTKEIYSQISSALDAHEGCRGGSLEKFSAFFVVHLGHGKMRILSMGNPYHAILAKQGAFFMV